jgi:hypothetical protein
MTNTPKVQQNPPKKPFADHTGKSQNKTSNKQNIPSDPSTSRGRGNAGMDEEI